MFTHILVPTDFSAPSDAALEYARGLAARFGASLHLLHVVEDPYRVAYTAEAYVPEVEGLREDLIAAANVRLTDLLRSADTREFRVTTEAVIGMPAWSIVEYATTHGIDLIVMGTHGRGGFSHLLMGSVAEKVVQTAPCPVLTLRQVPAAIRGRAMAEAATDVPPALMATSTADGQC